MRNGRAMAVQAILFFLLQVCVLIFIVNVTDSVERSKSGCIICGKKSQRTPSRSVDSVQSNADLEACFGFVEKKSEDICEAWRKALQRYRNSGKTFHHVSVFPKFIFFKWKQFKIKGQQLSHLFFNIFWYCNHYSASNLIYGYLQLWLSTEYPRATSTRQNKKLITKDKLPTKRVLILISELKNLKWCTHKQTELLGT